MRILFHVHLLLLIYWYIDHKRSKEKNTFILQINKRALNVYGVNRSRMFFSSKNVYVLVFSGFFSHNNLPLGKEYSHNYNKAENDDRTA